MKGKGDNDRQIREQKQENSESLSKTKGTTIATRKANTISGIKRAVKGKEDNVQRLRYQKKQKNDEASSKTKGTKTTIRKANNAVKEAFKATIEPDESAHPYKSLLIMAGAEIPQEHFQEEEDSGHLRTSRQTS